jgi:hypothetical protein
VTQEKADPAALIDAAFAMGADEVVLSRERGGFRAWVHSTRTEHDAGRLTSAHASVFGYGRTWQDALVDAMVKVPASQRAELLDSHPTRPALTGRSGAVTRAERRRLAWGKR